MLSIHISYFTVQQIIAPDIVTKITRYEVNGMGNEKEG